MADASGDPCSKLNHGPVKGSGKPSSWMNRNVQNTAKPAESESELRSAA